MDVSDNKMLAQRNILETYSLCSGISSHATNSHPSSEGRSGVPFMIVVKLAVPAWYCVKPPYEKTARRTRKYRTLCV